MALELSFPYWTLAAMGAGVLAVVAAWVFRLSEGNRAGQAFAALLFLRGVTGFTAT